MNWWPYENYYIVSPLPPDEVRLRLEEHISPVFKGSLIEMLTNKYNTYYKGFFKDRHFKIIPVIVGRNSFIPQIKGEIISNGLGSRLHIKMTMLGPIVIFMTMALVFLSMSILAALGSMVGIGHFEWPLLGIIGVMVFAYFLMIYGFTSESISSKKFLLELLEAEYE